ncbi:molybdopterin dehydrogenase FAD-binding protein, partial [mine drainage metagenome]
AHADPAAELPAVACCLEATITVAAPDGERIVPASDFFTAAMTTAVQPEELVTSVHFPYATKGQGFAFAEIARRHGDFALAGVAIRVDVSEPLHPIARAVCFGVSDKPVVRDVSAWLESAIGPDGVDTTETMISESLSEGSGDFAADVVDTVGDVSGSTAYRRRLISTLARSELARAYARAIQNQLGTT